MTPATKLTTTPRVPLEADLTILRKKVAEVGYPMTMTNLAKRMGPIPRMAIRQRRRPAQAPARSAKGTWT
jgi:hypothetical protein